MGIEITTNDQKLGAIKPNTANVLTAVSKTLQLRSKE